MQLNLLYWHSCQRYAPHNILLIMKLIVLLLTTTFFQLSAHTYAQRITLSKQAVPLSEILNQIREQSGYDFFYNNELLKKAKPITIQLKDATIEEALKICFQDQSLTYTIIDKTVLIHSKQANGISIVAFTEVRGQVVDSLGKPLQGASVRVINAEGQRTTLQTVTNQQGYFLLRNVPEKSWIEVTYVGYISARKFSAADMGTIVLHAIPSKIDDIEVVLNTGYGQTRQSDLTGSVAQLTAQDLEGFAPHQDIASLIQGKAAGVNVQVSSGAPGAGVSVNIRGTTSLTGNSQPLWVIDGVPQYDATGSEIGETLYNLNVNDVESIDILRDASATAIYGSRAANGVIIVTTKKGYRYTRPQLDVSFNYGWQKQRDGFRMLNTEEFKRVITDAARNYFSTTGTAPSTGAISTVLDADAIPRDTEVDYLSAPFLETAFHDGHTQWWKEMTQVSNERKVDFSLRGSGTNNHYYISLGLPYQEGIVKGSSQKGVSARLNFDAKVVDKLTLGITMNGSVSNLNNKDVMVDRIWNFRPDFPMYDEHGRIYDPGYNEENPLTTLANRYLTKRKNLNGQTYLQFDFNKHFFVKSSLGIRYNMSVSDRFISEGSVYTRHKGQANITQSESSNWVFENIANYNNVFNDQHNLHIILGTSMEQGTYESFGAGAQNFPDQEIMTDIGSGSTALKPTSRHTGTALLSAFSRINYKFLDRYLVTGTFRADGSSRFGPDKRWGYFPSGAVAWILNKEKFFSFLNPTIFNQLKLRTSYGTSGSQVLGNNDWQSLYAAAQYDEQPGYAPSQIGNHNLRWETTTTLDIGLDFSLWRNRIRGGLGWYDKYTNDIVYAKNIPSSSSFTRVSENIASISNKGLEFAIQGDVLRKQDMAWSINFNIAKNTAMVDKINGVDDFIDLYAGNSLAIRMQEGEPLGMWYGFKWSGRYYQSMEEYNLLATQNPTTGAKIYYQSNLNSIRPGDLRYEDINGDGLINDDDKIGLGNSQPKYFGGFGTDFRKGNFSVNVNFVYNVGSTRYWYTNSANWYGTGLFLKNYPEYVLDSWSLENRTSAWPRMAFGQGSSNTFSDFWISKADYLKLSLIRINYRIPDRIAKRYLAGSLDVSLSGTNLFTVTNYNGIDPEGNFRLSGGASGMGTDYGTYPSMRSYNFSIRYSLK